MYCTNWRIKFCDSWKILNEHRQFIVLFIISFIFHLAFILLTGLDLAPDEAHYWEWSRRLGLSYYSKGPAVAYIIAFFTWIFGNNPFGVRFGATVLSQIMLVTGYWLVWKMFGDKVLAFLTAFMMLIIPLFALGAVVMTTDPIYITCWALCLFSIFKLVSTENTKYFYLFAIFAGIGFLAKYTMAMILISFFIYFLSSYKRRVLLNQTNFYLSVLLFILTISPMLIWTISNDFINFLHVFHQGKNQSASELISLKYFFEFIGGQLGIISPVVLILMIWASIKSFYLPKDHKWREHFVLLNSFGLPVFVIFFFISFKVRIHQNWPAVAYFAMLILTAGICYDTYFSLAEPKRVRFKKILYLAYGMAGFIFIMAFNLEGLRFLTVKFLPQKVELSTPFLDKTINNTLLFLHNPRKDPTNRLKGWKELGAWVDELMKDLDEDKYFIFSSQYQIAGQVAFYTKKQYRTYSINLGRRINQYDIWQGWDKLYGKNAIQIEDTKTQIHPKVGDAFEKCETLGYFNAERLNIVIKTWTIFKCYNFKGVEEGDKIISY